MSTITKRLEKLEAVTVGKGRTIVLKTGCGHTDADVTRILEAHGIRARSTDTVVCLATIYEDADGNDKPADFEPELLSVN